MTQECEKRTDWCARFIPQIIGVTVVVIGGMITWAIAVEVRLQKNATIVDERGPRISLLEKEVIDLFALARDPRPKPETKVMVDNLNDDVKKLQEEHARLRDRLDNFHAFIMTNPKIRPDPLQGGPNFRFQPHP